MMNKEEFAVVDSVAETLYSLNASISAQFIVLKRVPTKNEISNINFLLGSVIKELRGLHGE